MTVAQMTTVLNLKVLAGSQSMERLVVGGYCGDLLSWVMGRAQEDDVWITVMGNLNAIAVAVLADVSCILLSENAVLDEDARQKAEEEGVAVLQSDRSTYDLAVAIGKLLS